MPTKPKDTGRLVIDYIKKYPMAMKLTLAKMIVAENPGVFKSVEHVRDMIRYYYNQHGTKARRRKKIFDADDSFMGQIHETESNKPTVRKFKSGKALIIGDIHGHKHHEMLRDMFLFAKGEGVNIVYLNGDISDNESCSRWPQLKRSTPLQEEVELLQELLADISDLFPEAVKVYKKGNHEIWFDKELWKNPGLMSNEVISERLKFEDVVEAGKFGFEVLQQRDTAEFGKLLVTHGHEAKKGGIYIAKAMLEYYKRDVCFNHFHRIDFAQFDVFGGNTIKSYGLPCACQLEADYTGINNQWKAGFAICEFTENEYDMRVFSIQNGKIKRAV